MSFFLQSANDVGLLEQKPVLKIDKMTLNINYPILNICFWTHSVFGRTAIIETADNRIYLPKRYVEKLTEDDIKTINEAPNKYGLVFTGQKNTGKGAQANLVKIIQICEYIV